MAGRPDRLSAKDETGFADWQLALTEECRKRKEHPPVFNVVSDRRGGRTAWSATVSIRGHTINAKYWYDGAFVENARDDAAKQAYDRLTKGLLEGMPRHQMPTDEELEEQRKKSDKRLKDELRAAGINLDRPMADED